MSSPEESIAAHSRRARRFVGFIGLGIVILLVIGGLLTKHDEAGGVKPGYKLPPFAVPLALGALEGDANVATRPNSGSAGSRPACAVRGANVLNICQLYERGPVVLALFVDSGSCPEVLESLQRLVPSFPGVQFAAVSIKGGREQLRRLVRAHRLTFPVGYDRDGALVSLYKVVSCPQIVFAYPGGVAQSRPLLNRPSPATLRARVSALVAAARARGWRGAPA
jgi:hypothetical protein